MRYILAFLVVVALRGATLLVAEDAPVPVPFAIDKENDLTLEQYKKIHAHLEAYYGVAAQTAEKLTKAQAKEELQKDAKEHKDVLLKALRSAQTIHRELAAMTLEFNDDKDAAVKALCSTLIADPDTDVRIAAAGSLNNLKDATSVDALIKALDDKDETVRAQAVSALGKIKDNRAAQPLLTTLNNDDKPGVRVRAASALAEIKDASTVMALLTALDEEKDQRVRMAIASALRTIRGQETPATKDVPDTQEHQGVLTQLSEEMRGVEEKLRNDRYDRAVQVDQQGIEEKLSKIIEQIEKMQSQSSQSKGQGQEKKDGQPQPGSQPGNQPGGPKQGGSPLQDSALGGSTPRGDLNAAQVEGKQADWAKLPAALREQLLQASSAEMPTRWKKRLEAYWTSIAREEEKSKP